MRRAVCDGVEARPHQGSDGARRVEGLEDDPDLLPDDGSGGHAERATSPLTQSTHLADSASEG